MQISTFFNLSGINCKLKNISGIKIVQDDGNALKDDFDDDGLLGVWNNWTC